MADHSWSAAPHRRRRLLRDALGRRGRRRDTVNEPVIAKRGTIQDTVEATGEVCR